MASAQTYFSVLGVKRGASPKEIKTAYFELARAWHPDRHEDGAKRRYAESKMKTINEAWSVLSDETKRREYEEILDRFGRAGPAEYARKRYEEHVGIWKNGGKQPRPVEEVPRPRREGEARYDASGRKIPDFVHVDGPRAVFHGKPFRQRNQESRSRSKRSVVVMGAQDRKAREPRKSK